MSDSLAAELLADFDDTDEEVEETEDVTDPNGLFSDFKPKQPQNEFGMELDGDEEDEDEDADMDDADKDGEKSTKKEFEEGEDEEVRKAKIEKMQLKGVQDVRNVASLMKTLEPLLEVCSNPLPVFRIPFLFPNAHVPDPLTRPSFRQFRKSNITKPHRFPREPSAILKMIRNTSCSSRQIRSLSKSIMRLCLFISSFGITTQRVSQNSRISSPTRLTMQKLSPYSGTIWMSRLWNRRPETNFDRY